MFAVVVIGAEYTEEIVFRHLWLLANDRTEAEGHDDRKSVKTDNTVVKTPSKNGTVSPVTLDVWLDHSRRVSLILASFPALVL